MAVLDGLGLGHWGLGLAFFRKCVPDSCFGCAQRSGFGFRRPARFGSCSCCALHSGFGFRPSGERGFGLRPSENPGFALEPSGAVFRP